MIEQYVLRSERFFTRYFGLALIRRPVNWPGTDPILDYVMAFHYCRERQEFRFDRHYNPLSKAERFRCGGCGREYRTREFLGLLMFHIQEAARIARTKRYFLFKAIFFKVLFFGLGKYTPDDRGGKTSGELEFEATMNFGAVLAKYFYFQ